MGSSSVMQIVQVHTYTEWTNIWKDQLFFYSKRWLTISNPNFGGSNPNLCAGSLMINHRKPSETIKNHQKSIKPSQISCLFADFALVSPCFSSQLKIPRLDNISAPDITACGIDLNPARLRLLCKNLSENTWHGCKMGIEKAGWSWSISNGFRQICVLLILFIWNLDGLLGDFLEFGEVRKLGEIWEINEKVGDVFFLMRKLGYHWEFKP